MMKRFVLVIALCCLPATALAETQNSSVRFVGEITGVYHVGVSDSPHYEGAGPTLDFDNVQIASPLSLEWGASFKLAMVFTGNSRLPYSARSPQWDLPQLVGQWMPNENWQLLVGRSFEPFGLQNELRHLPMKRKMALMPSGFYGSNNLVGSNYTGVGLGGRMQSNQLKWGVDLYGGQSRIPTTRYFDSSGEYYSRREGPWTAGGRLVGELVDFNLSLALSGKVGLRRNDASPLDYVLGGSLKYHGVSLEVLFEALFGQSLEQATDFYLQVAYSVIDELSVVARFDWLDVFPREAAGRYLRHHQEIVAGLVHQITDHWRSELTVHLLTGNRFARPEGAQMRSVTLKESSEWSLHSQAVMFGVIFSF